MSLTEGNSYRLYRLSEKVWSCYCPECGLDTIPLRMRCGFCETDLIDQPRVMVYQMLRVAEDAREELMAQLREG